MSESSYQTWKSFLPRRAIIMARHRPAPEATGEPSLEQRLDPKVVECKSNSPLPTLLKASDEDSLSRISQELQGCQRCKLCSTRKNIVIGDGNPRSNILFIGEGPGEQEDLQGVPFVGKAGQLLDRMIAAISLDRNQVYIANVVKCRPPGNRNPEPDEIQSCEPFLFRQIDIIRPRVIVALGKFAAQTLLKTDVKISSLRGKFHPYRGAKLMPTFHPAYLLRNPSSKKEAWMDLQLVARELGIEIPKRTG